MQTLVCFHGFVPRIHSCECVKFATVPISCVAIEYRLLWMQPSAKLRNYLTGNENGIMSGGRENSGEMRCRGSSSRRNRCETLLCVFDLDC